MHNFPLRRNHLPPALAVMLLAIAGPALAVSESEGNNSFADREVFAPGITSVEGQMYGQAVLAAPDQVFSDSLNPGDVNSHVIDGQAPGSDFYGAIDNSASGVDTFLGSFDESDSLIASDDDGSPFGDGLASALSGSVNPDGSIRFQVTGCCDNFDGTHNESGAYDLLVFFSMPDLIPGDVDFFSFTGLTPGELLSADITDGNFDTALALFDDVGNLIDSNDDNGVDLLSTLVFTVPDSGIVNLAVGAYGNGDISFEGEHSEFGDYVLEISPAAVPLPAAFWLFGSALVGLVFRQRRS